MNRLSAVILIWLGAASTALALSNVIPVTATTLVQDQFEFSVKSNPTNGGISFHVTITAKSNTVPAETDGHMCLAKLTGDSKSIGPLTAETEVPLHRRDRTLTAAFVASGQLMKNPEACFVFRVRAKGPSDRPSIRAADYYVLTLHDFAK